MSRKRDICTKRNTDGRGRQRMHEDRRSQRFWPKCRLWSTMTSGRSLAEQQNSQEFFSAFGLFDTHSSLIVLRWFNPRVYLYPPSRHPVSSCFRHRCTASQTCRVPRFVPTRPRHVLRAFLLPFPIRRLFHLVSLLRHPYMSSTRSPCMRLPIVPRSWLSWVCQVSNAPGGLYAYPIFAFIYLSEGVCGYPLLPLLFMSAAFYLSAKFDVSISFYRVCSLSSPHRSRPVNRPPSSCFSFLYLFTVSPLSSFPRVSPSLDIFLLHRRCRCRHYLAFVFISPFRLRPRYLFMVLSRCCWSC